MSEPSSAHSTLQPEPHVTAELPPNGRLRSEKYRMPSQIAEAMQVREDRIIERLEMGDIDGIYLGEVWLTTETAVKEWFEIS